MERGDSFFFSIKTRCSPTLANKSGTAGRSMFKRQDYPIIKNGNKPQVISMTEVEERVDI